MKYIAPGVEMVDGFDVIREKVLLIEDFQEFLERLELDWELIADLSKPMHEELTAIFKKYRKKLLQDSRREVAYELSLGRDGRAAREAKLRKQVEQERQECGA